MWQKLWSHDWFKILVLLVSWQACLLGLSCLVTTLEPLGYHPTYALSEVLESAPLPAFLARLGGFDGVHYQTIIHHRGYSEIGGIQAFFPLYPICLWLVNFLTHQTIVSGLLISFVSLYGCLYLGFRWASERYGRRVAWWLLAILLLLPGSFFYATVYTESLFMLLLLATFYAYDHRQYGLVGLFGALLSACRIVGILAVGALVLDYLYRRWRRGTLTSARTFQDTLLILLGSAGLLAYMIYLYAVFHDPLMFMHVQADFGAGRDAAHLVLLPQVFWRYLKMLAAGFSSWIEGYRVIQEFLVSSLVLAGLIGTTWHTYRRRPPVLPLYVLIFSWAAYLIGPTTGNFQSMSRYTLVCLAVYVLLAHFFAGKRRLGIAFCLISGVIFALNLLIFLEGYMIA